MPFYLAHICRQQLKCQKYWGKIKIFTTFVVRGSQKVLRENDVWTKQREGSRRNGLCTHQMQTKVLIFDSRCSLLAFIQRTRSHPRKQRHKMRVRGGSKGLRQQQQRKNKKITIKSFIKFALLCAARHVARTRRQKEGPGEGLRTRAVDARLAAGQSKQFEENFRHVKTQFTPLCGCQTHTSESPFHCQPKAPSFALRLYSIHSACHQTSTFSKEANVARLVRHL